MKKFTETIQKIDQTNSTKLKIEALANYFETAESEERIYCIALFTGKKPKGVVRSSLLRKWAAEIAQVPEWLFEETYHIVGDLAETIAKIIPINENFKSTSNLKLSEVFLKLHQLKSKEDYEKKEYIVEMWQELDANERFVFNKMLTGGFRIGVSQKNLSRALSQVTGKTESEMAYHLMGNWSPLSISYDELLFPAKDKSDNAHPYPFCLAHPLEDPTQDLGKPNGWIVEYKWDGIRGQLIFRDDDFFIWSRGEELVTHQFPEFLSVKESFKDNFVLDGEIVVMKDGEIQPFSHLQKRLGRKNPSKKVISEYPVHFIAYDLLEYNGNKLLDDPLQKRKSLLNSLLSSVSFEYFSISYGITFNDWNELKQLRKEARSLGTEGLMIKKADSVYKPGRKVGNWWKWKVEPFTIDVVMVYAMRGHGRRANLFSDFTFALWHEGELLTITKAYSGLSDKEMKEVDQFVKKNTVEKFGPVYSVVPKMVFEIAFDGLMKSSRHKSGYALRFPRMKRIRKDKKIEEANTLGDLEKLYQIFIKKEEL